MPFHTFEFILPVSTQKKIKKCPSGLFHSGATQRRWEFLAEVSSGISGISSFKLTFLFVIIKVSFLSQLKTFDFFSLNLDIWSSGPSFSLLQNLFNYSPHFHCHLCVKYKFKEFLIFKLTLTYLFHLSPITLLFTHWCLLTVQYSKHTANIPATIYVYPLLPSSE